MESQVLEKVKETVKTRENFLTKSDYLRMLSQRFPMTRLSGWVREETHQVPVQSWFLPGSVDAAVQVLL